MEKQIKINGFNSDNACVYFNHLGNSDSEFNVRISWNNLTLYETTMGLANDSSVEYYVGFNNVIEKYLDYIDVCFFNDFYEENYNLKFDGKENNYIKIENLKTNLNDSSYYSYNEVLIKEIYEDKLVRIYEDDIVVDIGANYGFFSLYAKRFNPKKIISFEPSLGVFELLNENVSDVELHQKAVSGNSGILNFSEIKNSTASSRITNDEQGYMVDVIGINQLHNYLNLEKIDYLKIDCEGSEKEIFQEITKETLSKINKIVVEYHSEEIKSIIINKIIEFGFKIEKDFESVLFCYNPDYFSNKRKVALISTYCDTEEKKTILLENVKKLKGFGVDVVAISPIPLPEEIISECDYLYFTKENPILKWPVRLFTFWHEHYHSNGKICVFHRGVGDYGWAALYHVKKLTQIMMPYDYDIYYHMIYDLEIDETVENAIKNFEGNIVYPRRDPHHPETLWETTLHFMSFDKDLMKKIEKEITLENYLSTNGVAEGEVYKWKNKFKISSSEHPVRDKIYYWKDYDFFDYSPIQDFKLFISKNEEMTIWVGETPPIPENLTSNLRVCFYGYDIIDTVYFIINGELFSVVPKKYEYEEFTISSQKITSIVMRYKEKEYDLTEKFSDIMLNEIFYNHRT